ncbi:hypothetical protein D3C76_1316060 [compost metagenome]
MLQHIAAQQSGRPEAEVDVGEEPDDNRRHPGQRRGQQQGDDGCHIEARCGLAGEHIEEFLGHQSGQNGHQRNQNPVQQIPAVQPGGIADESDKNPEGADAAFARS